MYLLFPVIDLMTPENCYQCLLDHLHPYGLRCPYCPSQERCVHRRDREPLLYYRCKNCHKTYNIFSKTDFEKSHLSLTQIVLLIRGDCKYHCTRDRHLPSDNPESQAEDSTQAYASLRQEALTDKETETDEMFAHAGKKSVPHLTHLEGEQTENVDMAHTPMTVHL